MQGIQSSVSVRSGVQVQGESARLGGKYVTFFLGKEEYGLPILHVREIIGLVPITPIPQTPSYIRGIINLRGSVIPIVDLRAKFGMAESEESRENCIIVVRAHGMDTGLAVDRMSEVSSVDDAEIQEPPPVGADVNTDFILGIDKTGGKVKLLLDIEKVISGREIQSFAFDSSISGAAAEADSQ